MIPGIVAASRRLPAASLALWTPLDMSVVPQIYLDAQDSAVTDVSGFASAISNLGAMGSNGDFSQATADNRPTILEAELNGNRVLSFDGINDELTGTNTTVKGLFRNKNAAWALLIYKRRGAGATAARIFHASTGVDGNSRFILFAGLSSTTYVPIMSVRRLDGDTTANLSAAGDAANGVFAMTLGAINYGTRTGRIYVNGALSAENAALTAATGATSDTASFEAITLGARAGGIVPANVDIAAAIISNTYPADSDIDKLFGWAAHKYGLTANLPSGHPYKTTPPYA